MKTHFLWNCLGEFTFYCNFMWKIFSNRKRLTKFIIFNPYGRFVLKANRESIIGQHSQYKVKEKHDEIDKLFSQN